MYLAIDANMELAEEEHAFNVFGYLKKLRQSRRGLIDDLVNFEIIFYLVIRAHSLSIARCRHSYNTDCKYCKQKNIRETSIAILILKITLGTNLKFNSDQTKLKADFALNGKYSISNQKRTSTIFVTLARQFSHFLSNMASALRYQTRPRNVVDRNERQMVWQSRI